MVHETKTLRLLSQPQATRQEDANLGWNLKSQTKPHEAGSPLTIPPVPTPQGRKIATCMTSLWDSV